MSGTCEAKRDVSKQSKGNHNIQNKQQCQWLSACLGNQREVSGGVAVMWKVVGGVGAGGGNGVGLCSILVGEISCGYMLTAKNMRKGKMFVENVFEECLTFFQKVDKVSSLEY